MGLKPGGRGFNTGLKGVFVQKGTITAAEDATGTLPFEVECAIKVTVDIGREFNKDLTIYGDFKKDERGCLTGWGSAFRIDRLINHVGGWNGELNEPVIPQEALECLIGKTVMFLQYVKGKSDEGKTRYATYQIVADETEGMDYLVAAFKKDLKEGYLGNYHPEVLDGGDTSFEPATNGTAAAEEEL